MPSTITRFTAPAPLFPGGRTVEFAEREYREPGPGQLLVRPRANAVCGSDRSLFVNGAVGVAGHETAGDVIAAGPDTSTPIGSRGVVYAFGICGVCPQCRSGATNVCTKKTDGLGFGRDGGFGPFELIEERLFVPIPDDLPYDLATMLLDVMGTSGHALDRGLANTPAPASIHVIGAGPVGLGAVLMARLRLPSTTTVWVSDLAPKRLELAAQFGATPILVDRDAVYPDVDMVIDTSGLTSARHAGLVSLHKQGVLVCVGHGNQLIVEASPELISAETAITGVEYFPIGVLRDNLALMAEHRDLIARVITHRFDVADVQAAFEVFLGGDSGKVVVLQDAWE